MALRFPSLPGFCMLPLHTDLRLTSLTEKRVPKRCPWGAISINGTLFSKAHSFFLNPFMPIFLIITFVEKRVPLQDRGTIPKNGTPRGTMGYQWGTIFPISTPFCKSGTVLVPFLPKGYCFEAKKG